MVCIFCFILTCHKPYYWGNCGNGMLFIFAWELIFQPPTHLSTLFFHPVFHQKLISNRDEPPPPFSSLLTLNTPLLNSITQSECKSCAELQKSLWSFRNQKERERESVGGLENRPFSGTGLPITLHADPQQTEPELRSTVFFVPVDITDQPLKPLLCSGNGLRWNSLSVHRLKRKRTWPLMYCQTPVTVTICFTWGDMLWQGLWGKTQVSKKIS